MSSAAATAMTTRSPSTHDAFFGAARVPFSSFLIGDAKLMIDRSIK